MSDPLHWRNLVARLNGPISLRKMALALGAILLFASAPILFVLIAMGLANANGCTLNEAGTHACLIAGVDFGEALAFLFVMGWFALMTLPIGAIALLIWIVVAIVLYVRRKPAAV